MKKLTLSLLRSWLIPHESRGHGNSDLDSIVSNLGDNNEGSLVDLGAHIVDVVESSSLSRLLHIITTTIDPYQSHRMEAVVCINQRSLLSV